MTKDELIQEAFQALQHSYSPYSHCPVGAAVLTRDGEITYGANIENASYPASNCAERSALYAAYSKGYTREDITALAIVSNGRRIAAPCGVCRQVLHELLHPDTPIYLSNGSEEKTVTIQELMPMAFGPEDLL
jgi:cytidine deaminase